ncbi:MAG TPA: ATP-binding protein [Bacteroidales bacterium]|nr:ATP-binding protein [Bacteroidales bacterium]
MVFRHFYIVLLARVIVLALSALLTGYFFFKPEFVFTSTLLGLFFIAQVTSLVFFLNKTNTQLATFVNYIENEDPRVSFRGNGSLIRDRQLYKYFSHLSDIIADYRIRERQWQHLLDYTVENLDVGILVISENLKLEVVNKPAKTILGMKNERQLDEIANADPGLVFAIKSIMPGQRRIFKFRQGNDFKQLLIKSTLFRLNAEHLKLVSMQDIRNELQNKEMESWQKLIRVITHEVNNTVSPVTSLASLLLEKLSSPDGQESMQGDGRGDLCRQTIEGLRIINERNAGLLRFVSEFRSTTLPPQIAPEHFRVYDLIAQTGILLASSLEENGIRFTVNTRPPSLTVFADKKLLSHVMINLVKNAIESYVGFEREEKEISISARMDDNDRVVIQIADNGPGIPGDVIDKIFVPFFTTKESGSGVGLSFSRQVISKHHGSLEAFSDPGSGSRFIIRI